jgi:hypothetical protein
LAYIHTNNSLVISEVEEKQIAEDLENIPPIYNQVFDVTSDYSLDVVKNKAKPKESEKTVLREIKEDNTFEVPYTERRGKAERTRKIIPTYNEIKLKSKDMIYVPIWVIKFKSGNMEYTRRSLAASYTTVIDEIACCSKIYQTCAVCGLCGAAFCEDHMSHHMKEHDAS